MELFADDSVPDWQGQGALRINKSYASRFEHNKARDELQRLESKLGGQRDNGSDSESSSSDETEDEDGEQITPHVDAAILRTLAKIRSKDESLYDGKTPIFEDEHSKATTLHSFSSATTSKRPKRVTLADYQRSRVEELMRTSDDPARALAEATTSTTRRDDAFSASRDGPLPHAQEQEQLRQEVTRAFHAEADADDAEGGNDGFFTRKSEDLGGSRDGDEYRKFLLSTLEDAGGEEGLRDALRFQLRDADPVQNDADAEASGVGDLEPLKSKSDKVKKRGKRKQADKAKEDEEFLMNYILNRGWMENAGQSRDGPPKPTKHALRQALGAGSSLLPETAGDDVDEAGQHITSAAAYDRDWDAEAAELSSEASFDSRAEAFETAYNFRYETMEAGEVDPTVPSYARNPLGSVRRSDDARKAKREERKLRKEAEKDQKLSELKRYRDLKRMDIVERLKQLKEATGSAAVGFESIDLDADFDPDAHDKVMDSAFGEAYYGEREADGDFNPDRFDADGKPIWDDDIDMGDVEEGWGKDEHADEGCVDMDADFLDGEIGQGQEKMSKKDRKRLKKKLRAAEKKAHAKNTPAGEGADDDDIDADEMDADAVVPEATHARGEKKSLEGLMDEYYGLDYEDVIGDQPTRFKYTSVAKQNYGLTPVEILLAEDAQLNTVVGLKTLQPYARGAVAKRPRDLGKRLGEFRKDLEQRGKEVGGKEERNAIRDAAREAAGKKKRVGKKEREKRKLRAQAEQGDIAAAESDVFPENAHKRKREGLETEEEARQRFKDKKKDKRRDKKRRRTEEV